ncbi:MAG: translocation/assembly module TamB domain-containing protein, partial [Alphaproteobacteria bacterium]|nr:translocation/assembly module TamB domain-containing protein [Alphaproteobacteria bacterium]
GVTLAGGLEMDPRLGLSATHAGKGFTASVGINGTARKPEIALSSDPSYPEDEILALIIFGRSKARLSAVEVLQLAQSTRALLSGEAGTLDTVRKTIGVDVLTFAPGASEGEAGRLKAGKYLRDDVYVGVEQGITAGSSRSVIEWSMTPNVTVEGTVGGSANPSTLGIQRRWEY